MIQKAFQHRSGRVIASGRVLLVAFFLVAAWLAPVEAKSETWLLLAWYALVSLTLLVATWNDWWQERRLGGPGHAVDLLVFALIVYLTNGFSNAFFAFAVFLILSATIRWGWREATLTAVLIAMLFLMSVFLALGQHPETPQIEPFVIRGLHLVVVSIIIIWFGVNQPARRHGKPTRLETSEEDERPPIRPVLEFAAAQFAAPRVVLAWWESEEPWTNVATYAGGRIERQRLGPREIPFILDPGLPDAPVLFDLARGRLIAPLAHRIKLYSRQTPVNDAFAERFDVRRGLRIPLRADPFEGEMFVLDGRGRSTDDLDLGERVRLEVSTAFARAASALATEEAAASRERLSFARDLHDSVVQFLAGLSMQLEGVRKAAGSGGEVGEHVDALQHELRVEQRDLRKFIEALRGGRGPEQLSDLSQYLDALTGRLSRRWGIYCRFESAPPAIQAPVRLRQDLELLLREALANAVRHGRARNVSVELERGDGRLELRIGDDGVGFPEKGAFTDAELTARNLGPWSLRERVHKRGGTLSLASSADGSHLTIILPFSESDS